MFKLNKLFDHQFFTASGHAVNLAIFRIVLMVGIPGQIPWKRILLLSELPDALRIPTFGLGWLVPILPMNPLLTQITATALIVVSVMGALGLFSRLSCFLTALLSFYVLGIDRFFGDVSHNHHHIVVFSLVLSLSQCGDALSIDAIRKAWKRSDSGDLSVPGPSNIYALPLRMIWILMGVIYFFPGYWKLKVSGWDWAFSDNLKYHMYQKWFWNNWTPFFRIDQYPILYKSAGLFTIIFEAFFIVFIFFPPLRYFGVILGVGFHTMTAVLLRVKFWSLTSCYVAFFDWHKMFSALGRWLYREPLVVAFDGSCKLCRRTISSLKVIDIFGRIDYVNAMDKDALVHHGLEGFDSKELLEHMCAIKGEKIWKGFYAYRAIAARIPFLWILVPLLYLWPVTWAGQKIYERVAASRICQIKVSGLPLISAGEFNPIGGRRAVLCGVTGMMIVIYLYVGFARIHNGWPIAGYPDFRSIRGPQRSTKEIVLLDADRQPIPVYKGKVKFAFTGKRLRSLLTVIIKTEDEKLQRERFKALVDFWKTKDPKLSEIKFLQVHKQTHWVLPERLHENPIKEKILYEIEL